MKRVKIKDICTVISGATPKTGNPKYWDGDIQWITPAELTDGSTYVGSTSRTITRAGFESASLQMLPIGTVLLSTRAPIGKLAITSSEMCCNQGFKNLVCSDAINNRYLFRYLLSHVADLQALGRGATFKELSKRNVENFEILLPNLESQLVIADKLEAVEGKQREARVFLARLDKLVKSRFVEMFGDPEINDFGFESATGKELFKIGNGKTRPNDKRFEEGIPAYGGNGVSWYTDEALVDFDTIIIGRVGRHCGNTRLVKAPAWVTDNAMFIKDFKRDCFELVFLSYLMGVIDFNRFADQGDLWKISQKPFMEYRFYIPPRELQQEFASFVQQVDKLEFETQQAIDKLQMLYDSLAQEYFGDWDEHGEE